MWRSLDIRKPIVSFCRANKLKRRPKICFVHGQLGLGGAEVLRRCILAEMVRRDWPVEVVQLKRSGRLTDDVKALGVPVTTLGSRGGLFDVAGVRRLKRFLKQRKFDVVQSSQFVTNLHTGFACRSLGITNHVIEEHGIYLWKKAYHRWLDRRFNAKAAAVVACSNCVAESASQNLNLPIETIDVVHNCVGENHLQPIDWAWKTSDDGQRQRRLWVGGQPVEHLTGIVGTLRWEKGHRFLLEAWRRLQDSGKLSRGHHLLIVGDGPLRNELETDANDLSNVHFVGSVSDPRSVLRNLDLFVLPSVNEGFGIAIIEAMAAGVPVVATESGGIPEVVTAETGFLVPPKDAAALAKAIESRLQSPLSQEVVDAARQRVESLFTPAKYVDCLESIYARLEGGAGH